MGANAFVLSLLLIGTSCGIASAKPTEHAEAIQQQMSGMMPQMSSMMPQMSHMTPQMSGGHASGFSPTGMAHKTIDVNKQMTDNMIKMAQTNNELMTGLFSGTPMVGSLFAGAGKMGNGLLGTTNKMAQGGMDFSKMLIPGGGMFGSGGINQGSAAHSVHQIPAGAMEQLQSHAHSSEPIQTKVTVH